MPRLFTRLFGLLSGLSERLRPARHEPKPAPPAQRQPASPLARTPAQPPYDLAKDNSTDTQKYLM